MKLNGQEDLKVKILRNGLIGGKLKGNFGLHTRKAAFVGLLVGDIRSIVKKGFLRFQVYNRYVQLTDFYLACVILTVKSNSH